MRAWLQIAGVLYTIILIELTVRSCRMGQNK